ncbi:hypothetical protein [Tessaracoccus defluvii]|uniref:Uncharacterized protein n=1 Tax=Tessaracoccus defluvii TaxID=1285901 RepID=A0A7H0HAY3_9ACTN|nr:hypothetical protein [Tessaracoccus defluvii]QNP57699.1 hypothetical protein H9L22_15695 [Tessaracoccus defluvii]
MGFLGGLFSRSTGRADDTGDATVTLTCDSCGCEVNEDEMEEGQCNDCYSSESLSVYDAADIWLSNGMDEDYTFGYDEDELRRAAGLT